MTRRALTPCDPADEWRALPAFLRRSPLAYLDHHCKDFTEIGLTQLAGAHKLAARILRDLAKPAKKRAR